MSHQLAASRNILVLTEVRVEAFCLIENVLATVRLYLCTFFYHMYAKDQEGDVMMFIVVVVSLFLTVKSIYLSQFCQYFVVRVSFHVCKIRE
jgi:hypothetical protein